MLADDREKFQRTRDTKYVEKAIRRGKRGWIVGAGIEVIPHLRRPHPALVWTEKGRSVPKIVMRKGSVVHRGGVEKLSSGLLGSQGTADGTCVGVGNGASSVA